MPSTNRNPLISPWKFINIHQYSPISTISSMNPWMLWFLVSICPCDDDVSQDGSVDRWEVPGSDTWLERTSHQRSAKSCSSLVFGALLLVVTHVDSELYSCSWSCCIGLVTASVVETVCFQLLAQADFSFYFGMCRVSKAATTMWQQFYETFSNIFMRRQICPRSCSKRVDTKTRKQAHQMVESPFSCKQSTSPIRKKHTILSSGTLENHTTALVSS